MKVLFQISDELNSILAKNEFIDLYLRKKNVFAMNSNFGIMGNKLHISKKVQYNNENWMLT